MGPPVSGTPASPSASVDSTVPKALRLHRGRTGPNLDPRPQDGDPGQEGRHELRRNVPSPHPQDTLQLIQEVVFSKQDSMWKRHK